MPHLLAILLLAQTVLLSRAPHEAPPYESVRGIHRYATPEEYASAAKDARFRLETVAYRSDGLKVQAYVYAPAKPKGKLPAVVYIRGSYVREEFAGELLAVFNRLAQQGYVVIAPHIRGSAGSEGKDEMGGADLADVMNLVPLARDLGIVDLDRLYLYGESRGGIMVFQAIREGFPARAAATFGALTDLGLFIEQHPEYLELAPTIWPDYAKNTAKIHERRSAVAWADKLDVPLLLMHGGDDKLNPSHTLALAMRLQQLGKRYEVIVRAGTGHVMPEWRVERDAYVVEWFGRHLTRPAAQTP